MSLDLYPERRRDTYVGRFRHQCQHCGRFVSVADAHAVYDDYAGGWEVDPYCPDGKGCRAVAPGPEETDRP